VERAAGHLMQPRHGHAEAFREFLSTLHGARTRLEERLVAQLLRKRQPALAQKPHVLRILQPDRVHSLAHVLPGRKSWQLHVCHAPTFFYSESAFIQHLTAQIVCQEKQGQVLLGLQTPCVQIVLQANTLKPQKSLYVIIVMWERFRKLAGIIVINVTQARNKKVQVSAKIVLLAKQIQVKLKYLALYVKRDNFLPKLA